MVGSLAYVCLRAVSHEDIDKARTGRERSAVEECFVDDRPILRARW
jgi:hypothetical protein